MAGSQTTGNHAGIAGDAPRVRETLKELLALSLLPGTGLRRWLLLGALGGLAFALGVGYLVRYFSNVAIPDFLPGAGESILFLGLAVIALGIASARLTSLVTSARVASLPDESLRRSMLRIRERARAPHFAAIGGGTGLSTMLRGLKEVSHITGIVTVADDGGSSGRLREELGMLPPGDIRNCIVALADAEPLMKDLFQYRFPDGSPLEGHSFGNLFIAAMAGVTGSFEQAVNESNRVLNVHGQIVPATLDNVTLVAEMSDGRRVGGESNITSAGGHIERLFLEPDSPQIYRGAREAIAEAQMLLIGPGSLYTSVIPNLLVPGISEAISKADAPVVYICNVASQPGETDGYTVADHVNAIRRHCPGLKLDFVVANSNMADLQVTHETAHIRLGDVSELGLKIVEADLMNDEFRIHHDSGKLADAIMDLYHETAGNNRGGLRRAASRNGGNDGGRQRARVPGAATRSSF